MTIIRRIRPLITSILILSAAPFAAAAGPDQGPKDKPFLRADLSLGADMFQRRYVNPSIRFALPFGPARFFADMTFEQLSNRDVEGELDIHLRSGLLVQAHPLLAFEGVLDHLSRHQTSMSNPVIFDVNEVVGRAWVGTPSLRAALGGGFYIGKQAGYSSLWTADVEARHIADTEFSFWAGYKFIDGGRRVYGLELSAGVAAGADLFIRRERRYQLDPITLIGIRFHAVEDAGSMVDKARLLIGALPFDGRHKLLGSEELRLAFMKRPGSRVLLTVAGDIPVLKTKPFFGSFRPNLLSYPLAIEYERSVGKGYYALGWFRFRTDLPLDIPQPFESRLSAGVGFRNQTDFDRLDRPVRFEVLGGRELMGGWQGWLKAGINTVGRESVGADVVASTAPGERRLKAEVFFNLDRGVHIRPFVGFESTSEPANADPRAPSSRRFQMGITVLEWF